MVESLLPLVASPLVKTLVDKFVAPKIEKVLNWCEDKHDNCFIPKTEHFLKYLQRAYEKYSIINTLVLHNTQLKLLDIYVAQTLLKEDISNRNELCVKIDKLPVELIKEYKKILITDTAGMGKSTITRRMFLDIIDNSIGEVGIPIYIELNKLHKNRSIIKEIQDELDSLSAKFNSDLLFRLIQEGGFIFFFDGYDEIPIADRVSVTNDIQTFISKAGTGNYYILTSRPEDGLTSFGDFQSFKIKALTKKEAFELLIKYDMTPNKMLSNKLIGLLRLKEHRGIDEYLKNPLLVSLLFAAFDHKQTIPIRKHLFYKQVYEAFFESHDLSKGIDAHQKRSGLFIDDFSRMLKYIGFICLMKIGVKFDEETIIKVINEAKGYCANLNFKNSDFLKDMLTSVPLFCKDGNEYKWVHKSLMEYFAARFIADEARTKQDDILTNIYKSEHIEKYINLLDLYYDIDNIGFIKNIEKPLLAEYISFHDSIKFESTIINKDLIEERSGYLFGQRIFFGNIKGLELNDNLFSETYNKMLSDYGVKIEAIAIYHPDCMIIQSIQPRRKLLSVLLKRKKYLFKSIVRKREEVPVLTDLVLSEIKIDTWCDDNNKYMQLNNLMSRTESWCPDYQQCINEIVRISDILKHNEHTLSLFEGF